MEFKCKICNKIYKSYQSLWNHNHKFHDNQYNHNDNLDNHSDNQSDNLNNHIKLKQYHCGKCNKEFSQFQNRWRHEKNCKEISKN